MAATNRKRPMGRSRDHVGPSDSFDTLVTAGADPARLHRLCAGVLAGAEVKQLGAQKGEQVVRLRRAEELRHRRFPGQLRTMAREVDEYISNPAFGPRSLLSKTEAKRTLRERVELQQVDVRGFISGMLNLPKTLHEFAAYVDLCLRQGTAKLSVGTKTGDTLSRAVILLLDYVEESTHSPRYQPVADLLNEILMAAGLEDQYKQVTPDDLCKLRPRNPRLRKSPKLFQI